MNVHCLKTLNRVELMPNVPSPFQMRDWKGLAKVYDEFVFNFDLTGDFLPLIWWDKSHMQMMGSGFTISQNSDKRKKVKMDDENVKETKNTLPVSILSCNSTGQ